MNYFDILEISFQMVSSLMMSPLSLLKSFKMNNTLLIAADYFFLTFHSVFTLFNILGWIFKKTRKLHLIAMSATAFSWFFLGIWYGFGYCFCTQWHWQVRWRLGYQDMPGSYIKFLLDTLTGYHFNPFFVDIVTAAAFSLALVASVVLNVRDWKSRHAKSF